MRINVYSQELTDEVIEIEKVSNGREVTGLPCLPNGELSGKPRERLPEFLVEIWRNSGQPSYIDATNPYREVSSTPIIYRAVQLVLHSSDKLHHPPLDDDRSAVTFWLPKSAARCEKMAQAFERIAAAFRGGAGKGKDD